MLGAVKSSPSACCCCCCSAVCGSPDKRNWGQWGGNCHWDEHQAPPPIQSTITTPNQSYTKVSRICSVTIPPLKKSLISAQTFDDNIFRGSSCRVCLGPFLGKVYLADFYFLALSIHGCGEKDREEGGRLKVWLQVRGGEEEREGDPVALRKEGRKKYRDVVFVCITLNLMWINTNAINEIQKLVNRSTSSMVSSPEKKYFP